MTRWSPEWIVSRSAGVMMPCRASMVEWAREPWMSWEANRLSKSMDALIASMRALGEDENRPPHMVLVPDALASSLTGWDPGLLTGHLPLPHNRAGGQSNRGETLPAAA